MSMNDTIIGWATRTLNPVHGCSKPVETDPLTGDRFLSPECEHCYAERLSNKFGFTPRKWTIPNEAVNVQLHPERLREIPKLPVKPTHLPPSQRERIFICSMGDTFHRLIPDSFLDELFDVMNEYPHIYQILTKRPERAAEWPGPWPDHIWLGTTCGDARTKFRIDHLRRSGAKVRFVSAEPLLSSLLPLDLSGIDQVIVGGESGKDRREMDMRWAREVRDECARQNVAFFFKQDSAFRTESRCYLVEEDGRCMQYRQFPGELTPSVEVAPDNPKKHAEMFRILS
jgi:protein gp37